MTPCLRGHDFVLRPYLEGVQTYSDLGMAQLVEAKGLLRAGKYPAALTPLEEALDVFAAAGPAAADWALKVELMRGLCLYHLHREADAVATLAAPFSRLQNMPTPNLMASPSSIACLVVYTCALLQAPATEADGAMRQAAAAQLQRVTGSAGSAVPTVHLQLLRALLTAQPEAAAEAAASAFSLPEATVDRAVAVALSHLVEGAVRHSALQAGDRQGLREVAAAYHRGQQALEEAFGEEPFQGLETPEGVQGAADLYSSLLQAAAKAQLALAALPPAEAASGEEDMERPPDPQTLAAEMLARALRLNRAVCPENRCNPKAVALLQQLYDLYFDLGLYVQVAGIYNSLLRCLEQVHGASSPQVLALMRKQHDFLLSVNAPKEASALQAHIAEVERQAAPEG